MMDGEAMEPENNHDWVYVWIQDPDGRAQILGQEQTEGRIAYVPVFRDKDAAMGAAPYLVKQMGHKYEVQAILYQELAAYARGRGFILFFIDEHGKVVERRVP